MRILSVNAFQPNSAAALIQDGQIVGAYYEAHLSRRANDSSFPDAAIRKFHSPYSDYDAVVCSVPQTYKASAKSITNSSPTLVDHREALAMSAIITKRWDTCAVLVVDTFYTAIGYYANKRFYWLQQFEYPNSLCLFYSAATRFLGYAPIIEETKVEALAQQGQPLFVDYILKNILEIADSSYAMRINLERGIGVGAPNADIACSVQTVFEQGVSVLAERLKAAVSCDNIVFVGKASTNAGALQTVSALYENIATCSAADAGASVIGAAALLTDVRWENDYLGEYDSSRALADDYVKDLLAGKRIPFIEGKQAFSLQSLGARCELAIPYIERVDSSSIAIVEESRFSEFFENGLGNGTTLCTLKKPIIPDTASIRCLTVTSTSNPYLSRILKLTTLQGFPALLYKDLGSPVVNNCETYVKEYNEI